MACTTTGKGRGRKITSKRSSAQLKKYTRGINPRNARKASAALGAKTRRVSTRKRKNARR